VVAMDQVVVATRFWATSAAALGALEEWIRRAQAYSRWQIVAVRVDEDRAGTLDFLAGLSSTFPGLIALPVRPWGAFSTALNAMLIHAAFLPSGPPAFGFESAKWARALEHGAKFILFQSIEVSSSAKDIEILLSHLDVETLVVGAALAGSHEFSPGEHELTGLTSPWNTCALWNLQALGRTGFLTVSDSIAGPSGPAIEEVAVIALQQHVRPAAAKAKLVKLESTGWDLGFGDDPKRKEHHVTKMRSKVPRAKAQLELLGVPPGRVLHIDATR